MNQQIVSSRIEDVLNVDSINSKQGDFLATHVPFRKISVTNDLSGTSTTEHISEEEIFDRYFHNSEIYNNHQLIIVDGSSGSGKSHFIRWIKAKLDAQDDISDVILPIRRSDNTLKGTIKQFLNIDEIKNLKNKDIYERLVKANQNVSENKFKYEIYHKFLVEIADDDDSFLTSSDRKNFRELLSSSEFEERMLMPGGPIERIYSKIVDSNSESSDEDVLALFDEEDFILDFEFNMKLRNNASKKAVKMANKLLPESDGTFSDEECNPATLVKYMNSKVESVIKACAGLEPGDFQQIFKEIRQELYSKNKNLILLIEDITACTGINRDLLDALIVSHTGSNESDKMCRLISVIGTTTEYFKDFRSNYLDRITTMITIEDGSIGNNSDDLVHFVAKYLNTMSLEYDDVEKWYKDGALDSEYPVHVSTENSNWDYYNYNGKRISIYPFTKKSIINLYNDIDTHKTPRYIIKKIIKPAMQDVMKDKKHFPTFLVSKAPALNFDVESRIKSTISNMQIEENEKDNYRNRIFAILGYWGDGTLNTNTKGYIGSVSINVFKEFGLERFAEKILGIAVENISISDVDLEPKVNVEIEPKVEEKKIITNKAFDDFARILSDWHYEKKSFTKAYQVRDEIGDFIIDAIPWQREGVPLISAQMVDASSYNLISIERQDRAIDKGLVLLEDSDETYQLLLAFGKWFHLGKSSWNFEGAASSIRFVTCWLEKNKSRFVDVVRANAENAKYPNYIRYAITAEIYRGIINGDLKINKLSDIKIEYLLKGNEERKRSLTKGHSQEWIDLRDSIVYADDKEKDNIELIHKYYNLIQGNKSASRKIINYSVLESDFKEMKKNNFSIIPEEFVDEKIKARNEAKDYLRRMITRLDKVAESECKEGNTLYKIALDYFGFPKGSEIEAEDVKDLLNEIIEFYKDVDQYGINISLRTQEVVSMKESCSALVKAFSLLSDDYSEKSTLEKLIIYSSNPMEIVKRFLNLLKCVDEDRSKVYDDMIKTKESLTRSGNWSDDVDPRFSANESSFIDLMKKLEE
ncbi:MAG: hypothetical protein IJC02_14340 [Lachnospiraceae bacterium]|nr:hypothetical protein [Lachnospiraceae bacterium]